jgi:adenylate cyclase
VLADGRTRPYRTYSFVDLLYAEEQILAGEPSHIDPEEFRDKIVFVGVTAIGLHDVFAVPFGEGGVMPGIQIHGNVADDILSGRFIRPAPALARLASVAAGGVAVGLAAMLPWLVMAVVLSLGIVGLFGLLAVDLFGRGLWLPAAQPVLAMALAMFGGVAYQYFVEGREKRKMRHLFGRYVPRDVCEQLIANPALAELGGRRREMTVLFSDIRGFTTLTEQGQAEEIVAQLNEYFSRMVEVLFRHRGTLDKFVGDMVMALFGAPLDDPEHPDHAVQAALDMAHELGELNSRWMAEGRLPLDIGIGINTGEMIAGNIGSAAIMSYTVIGDAVNLGARLESLNKQYGTRIIISEMTRARLAGRYDLRPLGEVVVKGKSQPVAIYEVRVETAVLPAVPQAV